MEFATVEVVGCEPAGKLGSLDIWERRLNGAVSALGVDKGGDHSRICPIEHVDAVVGDWLVD